MSVNSEIAYTDQVMVRETVGGAHTERPVSMDDLRTRLLTPPESWQEIREDVSISLASAGAKFKTTGIVVPAGAVITYVAMHVTTLVVASGTTVKLGLNAQASAGTGELVTLAALTKNTKTSKALAQANASSLALDVEGLTTALDGLGNGNFTAGVVRVIVVYNKPVVLADV